MAGHTREWRAEPEYIPEKGWRVVAETHPHVSLASGLRKERARQIVREHNMHERMLDALKLALRNLEVGCLGSGTVARSLRHLIAEAEKGGVMREAKTARQAARDRDGLDGPDAQALEGALSQAEREIDALKAELAKVTEELATAKEHIGQPLRLRVTLTKERDAARGDAEALAEALDKTLESFREEGCRGHPACKDCPERNDCEITPGLDALAAYRNSRNKETQNAGCPNDHVQPQDENRVG